MKKMIAALAVLMMIPLAYAATHTATWTKATTNTDGSPIPATGPGSVVTTMEYGTCNVDGTNFVKTGDVVVGTSGTSATTPNYPAGQRTCHRAYHVNTYGNRSDYTPVIQTTEPNPIPNPPSLLTVN